jgi:hypothetical protein
MNIYKKSTSKSLKSNFSEKRFFQSNKLKNAILKNKNLVKILNNKMFKGFNKIKTLMNPNFNIDEFIQKVSDNYYPIDENYEIYYQKKYLSKLKNRKASFSTFKFNNPTNESNNISKTLSKSKTQSEFFITNNNYNSKKKNKIYSILDHYREKNVNDEIFLNQKEKKITTSYPIIMIEKLHNNEQNPPIKLNNSYYNYKNDKYGYLNKSNSFKKKLSRYQSDFLYHLSHYTYEKNLHPLNFNKDKRLYKVEQIVQLRCKNNEKENSDIFENDNLFNNQELIEKKFSSYEKQNKDFNDDEKNENNNSYLNKYKNNNNIEKKIEIIAKEEVKKKRETLNLLKNSLLSNNINNNQTYNYEKYLKNDNRLITILKRLNPNDDLEKILLTQMKNYPFKK